MESVSIEFDSQGFTLRGSFFPAVGVAEPFTLLFVPGWPADPEDFLGLGPCLSEQGINVLDIFPRGMHESGGTYTHLGALQDIASALSWLRHPGTQERFKISPELLVLAGYSNGGGLALSYAAADPSVRRLVSCASNDFGEFSRQIQSDPEMAESIRGFLSRTLAPQGPARFDLDGCLDELADHPEIFDLRKNAPRLADRSILMFGGWEDQGPTVDCYQLPLYRSLKHAGAQDVTFIVYHTDHSFSNVRQRLADDIAAWILQGTG